MQLPSILKTMLILASAAVLLVAMHLSASFLVPVLLGIFFATLVTPIFRWLKRHRLSNGLALLLSIGFLALVAFFMILLVGRSLTALSESLGVTSEQLSQRQAELAALVEGSSLSGVLSPLASMINPEALVNVLGFAISAMVGLVKNGFVIFMVTIFVLAEAPAIIRRMRQSYGAEHPLTLNVTDLAQTMITYFGLRAIINLVNAVATGLMLWLFGIDYVGLWVVLIFFLSFIPYIGAILSMVPPVILAYAEGGLGLAVTVALLAMVINSLAENILQPMVMGKGLSVSPTVVFLSCMFWMFVMGGAAGFVAMPLTMALILLMRNFAETRGLAAIMVKIKEADPAPNTEVTIQS